MRKVGNVYLHPYLKEIIAKTEYYYRLDSMGKLIMFFKDNSIKMFVGAWEDIHYSINGEPWITTEETYIVPSMLKVIDDVFKN